MVALKPVSSAVTLLTIGLLGSVAWAQPNIGNVLQQVPSPTAVERQQAPVPTIRGQEVRAPLRELPAGSPTVTVREFRFAGNREVDAAVLQAQVATDIGKPLNFTELEELTTRLTRYYRSLGYFVARVYLPEQEITDGVITLQAVEGNYGQFILDNKSLVRDDIVQGMLDDVKKYDIVSLDTLERAMLIINDTPGSQVIRADVMPGEAVGTSDFAVGTVATPVHQGYVLVDNHGSRSTGRDRISANWDWSSPTGRGDRLSVSGLASFKGDLINGRLGYSTVLSPSGWRGEVALARTEYSLGDVFTPLDAVGSANSFELGVTYPIRRIRAQTIQFGLNYAYKDLKDEIRSTQSAVSKRSDTVMVSLSLRDERFVWGLDGVTQGMVALSTGQLDIRDAAARAADQAVGGANTHGGFSRLSLNLSRVSVINSDWSVAGSFKMQRALSRNLDGSERMGIAGSGGVMAYPSGELSGSDAELLRVELSRNLVPVGAWQHQASVLVNWGQARETDLSPRRDLSDVALGYVGKHGNGLLLKAYVAHRLSDAAQSERASRNRLVLQAGWVF
jgi:hemolysin activation/secretion protein